MSRLLATLRMLEKLTLEHTVDAGDMRAVLAAGASRAQIDDALAVGRRRTWPPSRFR